MPRRGNVAKRDVLADPIYNSKMVTRLVNSVMYDGKKGVAQKIVYGAFDIIKEKSGNGFGGGYSYMIKQGIVLCHINHGFSHRRRTAEYKLVYEPVSC